MDMKKLMILFAAAFCVATKAQEPLELSLQKCREMALAHDEDLQRADNASIQAELDKEIAFSAYLPKLDATATGTYMSNLDMMGMELQMRGMYMAGISLVQPLYAGGKIMAGNRLARIGKEVAEENRRKTRMQVIADADKAYWTYISVGRKVRMLDSYKAQMDTVFRQVEVALSAGMGVENDLLRIKTKRSEIHYQYQKAKNGLNLCRLALCNVLGQPLDTEFVPLDTAIAVSAPRKMDESIAARPELALLEKQVEAGEQQVKVTRGDILPQIGLSAGYLYYGNIKLKGMNYDANGTAIPFTQKFDDGLGLVMASVSIPLFHWGEGMKKVRKAKLDLENARLDLQKNRRLLSIEARQAVQNVTDGYRMVETAELASRQADENLRVMQNRYQNAMCTLTDLLNAQSQWQQAQSNLIEAQTQYKIYETEYLKATGRLETDEQR